MPEDFTDRFEAQVRDLGSTGGVIRIPAGDWLISRRVFLSAGGRSISIVGEGRGATTIHCNSADRTITLYNARYCTIRDIHFVGNSDWWSAGVGSFRPAIELSACEGTTIEACRFTNHVCGIALGAGTGTLGDYPLLATKTVVNNVSFSDCWTCVKLVHFLEAMISNVWSMGDGGRRGFAVIHAEPGSDQVYDSLILNNVHSTHPMEYGIRIVLTTGSKGANGRNQVGQFANLIFELCKGVFVDASAAFGRLDIVNYYGERVEINNCDDFHASCSQFQYGLYLRNCARSLVSASYVRP
jgi:hypothetical protein